MRKFKKVFILATFMTVGFMATACGKANTQYTNSLMTKGNTAAASAGATTAASSTPTPLQGYWDNCTSGTEITYGFIGNVYWTETDQWSSSDCSDENPSSQGVMEVGTFQLGAAPQTGSGNGQPITLTPAVLQSTATETGYALVVGTRLLLNINGVSLNLGNVQNDTSSGS